PRRRDRVPQLRDRATARSDRAPALLAEHRKPRLREPAQLPALLRPAAAGALLQLQLWRRAVPLARLQPLRRGAESMDAGPALLARALQGRLLPPPALVQRARLPQPSPASPSGE